MAKTFIESFHQEPGNDIFVRVDPKFILNHVDFFRSSYPDFDVIVEVLTSSNPIKLDKTLKKKVKTVYCSLHKQYINTAEGQKALSEMYLSKVFPTCPRILCHKTVMLPYGQSESRRARSVCFFCPNCRDLYANNFLQYKEVDGACFGSDYLVPFLENYCKGKQYEEIFVPKIYGFNLFHKLEVE